MDDPIDAEPDSETPEEIRLCLVLADQPALAILDDRLTRSFDFLGQRFESSRDWENATFYDCLWGSPGKIVGLGYLPLDGLNFLGQEKTRLIAQIDELDYAKMLFDDRAVQILLDLSASLDAAEWGGEQEFNEFRLFLGDAGQFAISVRTLSMTSTDIQRFLTSGVRQATLEIRD